MRKLVLYFVPSAVGPRLYEDAMPGRRHLGIQAQDPLYPATHLKKLQRAASADAPYLRTQVYYYTCRSLGGAPGKTFTSGINQSTSAPGTTKRIAVQLTNGHWNCMNEKGGGGQYSPWFVSNADALHCPSRIPRPTAAAVLGSHGL